MFNERRQVTRPATLSSDERLLRLLRSSPEQQAAIDRILAGKMDEAPRAPTGPLLIAMGVAAKFLGVSRPTLWRMIRAGRLSKVEILPGSFRVRRTDLEAIAASNYEAPKTSG